MPQAAQARAWWAEVEDVRERIERRRVRESANATAVRAPTSYRGVREVRPGRHLTVVRSDPSAQGVGTSSRLTGQRRRRARPPMIRGMGPRPDRVAAWAVVLGFALVLAAILSAHG
jgi:hypothetical protein